MPQTTIETHIPFGASIIEYKLPSFERRQVGIISEILQQKATTAGVKKSNRGGWHSEAKLYDVDTPNLKWLVRKLFSFSVLSLRNEQPSPTNQQLYMTACWANVNECGDWNSPHAHQPSNWAGVCFIDVENNAHTKTSEDGQLIFINPLPVGAYQGSPPIHCHQPENGQVILFPGYLLHMVAPHFSTSPRISVAFNLEFERKSLPSSTGFKV